MVDMKELKNCPFCGGEASMIPHIRNETFEVRCLSDVCYEGTALNIEEQAAIEWNKRATDAKIESLAAQLNEAMEEIAKLKEPDFFYNADNWEVTYHEIEMLQDELDGNGDGIMRVGALVSLPNKYMIQATNQETDDVEYKLFDTKEEAEAALNQQEEKI